MGDKANSPNARMKVWADRNSAGASLPPRIGLRVHASGGYLLFMPFMTTSMASTTVLFGLSLQ